MGKKNKSFSLRWRIGTRREIMQREVLCTKSAHASTHSCTADFWLTLSFFAHHVIFGPQRTALQPRLVFGSILFVWIMSRSVKSMPSGQSTISFCMSDKASSSIYYLTDLMAPLPGQSVTGMECPFALHMCPQTATLPGQSVTGM
jgi:hypothetical protein